MSTLYRICFGILLTCFLSNSYCQDLNEFLEFYADKFLLKNNQIRSLTVFAELNEDDIREEGAQAGKIMEVEFNTAGDPIYQLTSDNEGNLPFIYYGRGSLLKLFTYDLNGLLTSTYLETYLQARKSINVYDSEFNLTNHQYIIGNDTLYNIAFEWRNGKMIKSTLTSGDPENNVYMIKYDDRCRAIQSISRNFSRDFLYEEKNDTLIRTITTRRSDTLVSTEIQKTSLKFNRIISYIKKDHTNKLEVEIKTTLDKNGNATYFYSNLDQRYPPYTLNIENRYDHRGLLSKRLFYMSREDVGNNILVKIEHYIFSSEMLTFKMKDGTVLRQEETDERPTIDAVEGDSGEE